MVGITNEEHLTNLIRRSEERLISLKGSKKVKGLIREMYELKLPEEFDWLMKSIKEDKLKEEKWLKFLQDEQRYLRQGLNPPFFYKRNE